MKTIKSPLQFLRDRRPESFSDSRVVREPRLNRSHLDFHLSEITSRNQENDFAEFARKLCEFEIAPNLRPQTGPVGGGDSKVDSETIPVAAELRLFCHQAHAPSHSEKYAFAISAKQKWTDKVRSDVTKIASLGRSFDRIYFITNQAARDKTRANIEDELSEKHQIPVTILDKTWILDRVFTNRHEKLAIDILRMGSGLEEVWDIGPSDFQRDRYMKDLELSISTAMAEDQITFRTVNECLDVAILARENEIPRHKVEGLFCRAIRVADKYGTTTHKIRATYQFAWTTFFWYGDLKSFVELFEEAEKLILKQRDIVTVELLVNLLSLLRSAEKMTTSTELDLQSKVNNTKCCCPS